MNVSILGCGPSGMFATHAAVQAGANVVIYSKPRKSLMRGAQYLHRPIPGLSGDSFTIDYRLAGDLDGYREKVYGLSLDVTVSPEILLGHHEAWDIREAYDAAWRLYSGMILPWDAMEERDREALGSIQQASDIMISTIPAYLLCEKDEHIFDSEIVWATDIVKPTNIPGGEDNVVICSGDSRDWWYRVSRIQGWENTEYPENKKPKSGNWKVWEVEKPIAATCSCHPSIIRQGRYGKWEKGVLSDAAYYETKEMLDASENQ